MPSLQEENKKIYTMTESALNLASSITPFHDYVIAYKKELGSSKMMVGGQEIEIFEDEYAMFKKDTRDLIVVAVGPKVKEIKKGDTIVIRRQDGFKIKIEGIPFIKIAECDVYGIKEEL